MKKSAWRLALSAVLFVAWIGYLAYLAATTTQPVVLSRPQFLSAELYVIAQISADAADAEQPGSHIAVKKVVWANKAEDAGLKTLQVAGLPSLKDLEKLLKKELEEADHIADPKKKEQSRHAAQNKFDLEKKFAWDAPGEFILALSHSTTDPSVYTVTALPRTPGFSGQSGRIYPATPATVRQLEMLVKEFHP